MSKLSYLCLGLICGFIACKPSKLSLPSPFTEGELLYHSIIIDQNAQKQDYLTLVIFKENLCKTVYLHNPSCVALIRKQPNDNTQLWYQQQQKRWIVNQKDSLKRQKIDFNIFQPTQDTLCWQSIPCAQKTVKVQDTVYKTMVFKNIVINPHLVQDMDWAHAYNFSLLPVWWQIKTPHSFAHHELIRIEPKDISNLEFDGDFFAHP